MVLFIYIFFLSEMKDVDSHDYLVFYVAGYPVSMAVAGNSSAGANDLGRSR